MKEIWKNINESYQVSNLGRIKSLNYNHTNIEKILTPAPSNKGYLQVCLWINGKPKTLKVHRLVAEAFIPNSNNYPCINHKDENKENNCVDNLEWCTHEYNNNYGTRVSKFSKVVLQYDLQGKFIREWKSTREIERELKIKNHHVCNCCNGKAKTTGGYIWRYKQSA